jgi:hypothetical protein
MPFNDYTKATSALLAISILYADISRPIRELILDNARIYQ